MSPEEDVTIKGGFTRWKEATFLGLVTGMSILFGFGTALSRAKKDDPKYFDKGLDVGHKIESGPSLALRALKWGTFYAVGGCGLLFFAIWKASGAKDMQEFREKAGRILPKVPKNNPPQGRTEFKNLTDFLQYLIDEDKSKKDKLAEENKQKQNDLLGNDLKEETSVR